MAGIPAILMHRRAVQTAQTPQCLAGWARDAAGMHQSMHGLREWGGWVRWFLPRRETQVSLHLQSGGGFFFWHRGLFCSWRGLFDGALAESLQGFRFAHRAVIASSGRAGTPRKGDVFHIYTYKWNMSPFSVCLQAGPMRVLQGAGDSRLAASASSAEAHQKKGGFCPFRMGAERCRVRWVSQTLEVEAVAHGRCVRAAQCGPDELDAEGADGSRQGQARPGNRRRLCSLRPPVDTGGRPRRVPRIRRWRDTILPSGVRHYQTKWLVE